MKILITEQQFKIVLKEKRSHHRTNIDPTFNEFLTKLLSNFNIDDIFLSFRRSIHVTDINPINQYNTPTGVYTYPLASFKDQINVNMSEKNFRRIFPFQNEQPYMVFFILKTRDGIVDGSTSIYKLETYVKRIKSLYHEIKPIDKLCDLFLNGNYTPTYGTTVKHTTHLFWLFLYDVVPYLGKSSYNQTKITNLAHKIGLNAFIDYEGDGYIHQAEPKQAVFFRFKGIGEYYYYHTKPQNTFSDLYDFRTLISKMSRRDNVILKFAKTNFSRLHSPHFKVLIEFSNDKDDIINLSTKAQNLDYELVFKGINYASDKNKISVLYYLNEIKNSDPGDLTLGYCLKNMNDPDKMIAFTINEYPEKIEKLIPSFSENVKNLNLASYIFKNIPNHENLIRPLIDYSKNPMDVINRLDSKALDHFIDTLDNYMIRNVLNKSSNKDELVDFFIKKSKYLSYDSVDTLLYYSFNREKTIDDIIKKFGRSLHGSIIRSIFKHAEDPVGVSKKIDPDFIEQFVRNINSFDIDAIITTTPNIPGIIQVIGRENFDKKIAETTIIDIINKEGIDFVLNTIGEVVEGLSPNAIVTLLPSLDKPSKLINVLSKDMKEKVINSIQYSSLTSRDFLKQSKNPYEVFKYIGFERINNIGNDPLYYVHTSRNKKAVAYLIKKYYTKRPLEQDEINDINYILKGHD